MSELKYYYVIPVIQSFDFEPVPGSILSHIPVSVQTRAIVGYLPVYADMDKAKEEWPDVQIQVIREVVTSEVTAKSNESLICGDYASEWEYLGKKQGWQGCGLPKGHSGSCKDVNDLGDN